MTEPDQTAHDTRVGAYAVIVDGPPGPDRRILLALWNEPAEPQWTMPGGGVEPGETTEQAAVREVFEETGYHVELDGLLGSDTFMVPAERRFVATDRPLRAERVIYTAHVVGGELRREVAGTTDEARWFPINKVPSLPRVDLVDTAVRLWREHGSSF